MLQRVAIDKTTASVSVPFKIVGGSQSASLWATLRAPRRAVLEFEDHVQGKALPRVRSAPYGRAKPASTVRFALRLWSDTPAMLPADRRGKRMAEHQQLLMPTRLAPRQCRRLILVCCLAMSCISPARAALSSTFPKAASVSVNVRTAGDLAYACTVKPASRTDFARLNFCNGSLTEYFRRISRARMEPRFASQPLAQTQRDLGRIGPLGSGRCIPQR
jgi:hypothetical protein